MANLNFGFSSAQLRSIEEIQFGLLSPEEIKSMSVAQIEYPETMDESGMKPRQMGLSDPRMGTIDRNYKCATCDQNDKECPGHFGHIELAVPVFHVGALHWRMRVYACADVPQVSSQRSKNCWRLSVTVAARSN